MFRDANGQHEGQPISAAFDPLPKPERIEFPQSGKVSREGSGPAVILGSPAEPP
jgi:hypothetical protein